MQKTIMGLPIRGLDKLPEATTTCNVGSLTHRTFQELKAAEAIRAYHECEISKDELQAALDKLFDFTRNETTEHDAKQ